ncbi:MAG: hypothetical protein II852_17220 [Bacteroidales bacterium]|nr:hypothetical protein [Bacteroidales bacterium]
MKSKYLFTSVVALALLSGCIKEEGDDLLIMRKNVCDSTVVTSAGGYMDGIATKDSIVKNSFETIIADNQIQQLNCYTKLHSEFLDLNTARNGIKEVGYVYSHTNKFPEISDKQNCKVVAVQKDVQTSETSVAFDGTIQQLDFNSTYYVRSYAICKGDGKSDSVIYNGRPLEYKTVLPEDVWVQRNDAPTSMLGRTLAFSTRVDINGMGLEQVRATLPKTMLEQDSIVYVYGGKNHNTMLNDLWRYDPVNDTWAQMSTFEQNVITHNNVTVHPKRCNGAMLAYPMPKTGDVLLWIIGGEVRAGEYTSSIFYYSTRYNRFANQADHPNAGNQFTLHDDDGNPEYECEYETNEDGSYKLDANGYKIPAKNSDGSIKYVMENGQPKEAKTNSTRNYIEELPIYRESQTGKNRTYYGLAGCTAFTLTDNGFTKFFVAFGKTDMSTNGQKHITTAVYEYDVNYDWDRHGSDLLYPAWKNLSATNDRTAEGLYQPVCVRCGDKVIIGTGESSRSETVTNNFYTLSYSVSEQNIRMESLSKEGLDGFEPRAAAAAFHLSYVKNGVVYNRFYVGTGRKCHEDDFIGEPEQLLNDFWCYDMGVGISGKWSRKADCSNILRQGAVGFAIKRADDYFAHNYGENMRGMFSFGDGCINSSDYKMLNDNWEYIP